MTVYLFLFAFVLLATLIVRRGEATETWFYIAVFLALTVIAGVRGPGVDRDYDVYSRLYERAQPVRTYIENPTAAPTDIGFTLVMSVFRHWLQAPFYLFTTGIAALSVGLKIRAFRLLSANPPFAVLLYVATYFMLHEMTQIRAGLASGFLLMGLYWYTRGYRLRPVLLTILASTIHVSSLMFLVIFFLKRDRTRHQIYLLLVLIAVGLGIASLPLARTVASQAFGRFIPRIGTYLEQLSRGQRTDINLFGPLVLVRAAIAAWAILTVQRISTKNSARHVMTKLYALSIAFFFLMSDFPVVAYRGREILAIAEPVLVADLASAGPEVQQKTTALVGLAMLVFMAYLFVIGLMRPYRLAI